MYELETSLLIDVPLLRAFCYKLIFFHNPDLVTESIKAIIDPKLLNTKEGNTYRYMQSVIRLIVEQIDLGIIPKAYQKEFSQLNSGAITARANAIKTQGLNQWIKGHYLRSLAKSANTEK